MYLELEKNIWEVKSLGFYCINIFKCSENNPNLKNLLSNNVLNENEFGPVDRLKKEIHQEIPNYYGAFQLDLISESDFISFDFESFLFQIKKYCSSEEWGEDLPVFENNFKSAISKLKNYNLNSFKYYYLDMEKIDDKKLIDPNFFIYLICIIAIETNSNKVITLTFGFD